MGDTHAGNDEGGSTESRAMALCVEEVVAAMSRPAREEVRGLESSATTVKAAQAAVEATQRQ